MKVLKLTALLISLFLFNSCIFFNTYQSARLLGKQEFEVSGVVSKQIHYPPEGYNGHEDKYSQVGILGGYGLSKRLNLRGRYMLLIGEDVINENETYIWSDANGDTTDGKFYQHYVELEPKLGLGRKERIALTLPTGLLFDEGDTDFQLTPTAIFSLNPLDQLALNLAIKSPWIVNEGEIGFAVTTGVTYTPKLIPLTVTPEFGVCWDEFETVTSFGLAFGFIKRNKE